jgi:hypothetical protein
MPNIFLLGEAGLVEMSEQPYDSEDLLQRLLAEHPSVLAGDQFTSGEPRRWLLVTREAGVPDGSAAADRWSVDHLFLDQDGVPTLVEVKRSSDSRIRRAVVGQMLDYAANAVAYWPVRVIQEQFENTCDRAGVNARDRLEAFLGTTDEPPDANAVDRFWQSVDTNLKAARVRLVFVADAIPPELRRVVEFLNSQMNPAEVLAIEIKQFVGSGVKTLVPTVIGQTARATTIRSGAQAQPKQWDRESFMAALRAHKGDEAGAIVDGLLNWAAVHLPDFWWGSGRRDGSCYPRLIRNGRDYYPFSIWTYGRIELEFQWMRKRPPFDREELMLHWVTALNEIPSVTLTPRDLTRRPTFDVTVLCDPLAMQQFISSMEWFIEQVDATK